MKYRILQLDRERESVSKNRKMFESWEVLNECCGGFDIRDYKEVYAGETDDYIPQLNVTIKNKMVILDRLFDQFNLRIPEDFKGHSLSVSDVVIMDNEIYFCDPYGWVEVI